MQTQLGAPRVSGGTSCRCGERAAPIGARRWRVTQRQCNHSAFSGYHRTSSEWSAVNCLACGASWRTKAGYVFELPDYNEDEWKAAVAERGGRLLEPGENWIEDQPSE